MDVARLTGPPEPWHLGFLLGPRINAGGRIGRAELGVRLLLEATIRPRPARIAAELDRLNRERQAIEQATLARGRGRGAWRRSASRRRARWSSRPRQGWHPGVVGLVAARLKERFGRPAFAIALEPGGIGTGSGRSIAGVDLGRAVRHAVADGLLLKGGGHAMAAGVTIAHGRARRRSAPISRRRWRERSRRRGAEDALLIDGAVTAARRHRRDARRRSRAPGRSAPGNPEPVFALPSHHASPMPRRSARRMCARGCAPATARCSTPSRSAPPASRSATR